MLRARLTESVASEKEARAEAEHLRDSGRRALESRNYLAVRIIEAATDAGEHRCPATRLADANDVRAMAQRHEERRGY